MRYAFTTTILAASFAFAGAAAPAPVPPFQVWGVTGAHAGQFHCPVCEQGLNPAVVLVVRGEAGKEITALTPLLKKVDELLIKNPNVSLRACLLFAGDGGYQEALATKVEDSANVADMKLTKALAARKALEDKLKEAAKTADLKRIPLYLAGAQALAKLPIDKDAEVSVLVVARQHVVAALAFGKDKPLGEKETAAVIAEVEKLIPKRR